VDTEVAPKKQEAKLTDYMKMVINLFKAGEIPPYCPLLPEEKECVVLINLIKTTEDAPTMETSLKVLRVMINVAGQKLRDSLRKSILATMKSLLSHREERTRLEAVGCMDSLVRHFPAEELEALENEQDLQEHQSLVWTIREFIDCYGY
jgi:hypothetical protein